MRGSSKVWWIWGEKTRDKGDKSRRVGGQRADSGMLDQGSWALCCYGKPMEALERGQVDV